MKSIWKSSAVMASATLISRALGLIREQVMASVFGASGMTDAFLVAYRIPNLLRDLFAEGAFSAAFVPTFTEVLQKSKEQARRLLWRTFFTLGGITLGISCLFIALAPEMVQLFAPSFVDSPEKFQLTVNLTRMMAPYFFFVSLSALFMGVLNSLKVFFLPSLASAFFNIVMILSMLVLAKVLEFRGFEPIYALGIGVLLGGLIQGCVQLPSLWKRGFGPLFKWGEDKEAVVKIFKKLGPGVVGFAATQINLVVNTILATGTVVGAVSWLSYAFRLFQFPVGVLGVSLGNSNLVHFSESWKRGDRQQAIATLKSSYETCWLIMLPSTLILYLFAHQGVHLVFERGQFGSNSTQMTALALQFYSLGLVCYGVYKIWGPTFYALDRPKIPVMASLVSIGFNIVFCLATVDRYGFYFLSLGTSISMFLNVGIQAVFLSRSLGVGWEFFISSRMLKIVGANIVMFFGTKWGILSFVFDEKWVFWKKALNLACCGIAFLLLYVAVLVLVDDSLRSRFFRKVTRKDLNE